MCKSNFLAVLVFHTVVNLWLASCRCIGVLNPGAQYARMAWKDLISSQVIWPNARASYMLHLAK